MEILFASKNLHKLNEFQQILHSHTLIPWPSEAPDIPEDGAFFQDNAIQKASFAKEWWLQYRNTTIDGVLADDAGLCVDALWGGPGVLSARFANNLTQDAKNRLLLSMIPEGEPRTARFICVLAWLRILEKPDLFTGVIEGTLANAPKGTNGFGYDSIFIPKGMDYTFSELPAFVKNQMSHRGLASKALLAGIMGK
jgi:XTP/dITP diphosphohydrolase